jgi:hypothetical protein
VDSTVHKQDQANLGRIVVISPLASAAVLAFEGALSPGRLGYFDPVQTAMSGVFGCMFGLASLAYVIPLLLKTDPRRSLSFVYGGTLAAALIGLTQMPLVALALMGATHLTLCVISARCFRRKSISANACAFCGYSLSGLKSSTCPECGRASTSKAIRHH